MTQQIALGQKLIVSPPATSANLGPGFDSLGLALEYRDRLEVGTAEHSSVEIYGDGADELPRDESHLIIKEMQRYWANAGFEPVGVQLVAHNNIPHARGMGSSAAAIVAAYSAADALLPIEARGGTEMLAPLKAALADPHPEDGRVRQVVFLTDGAVGDEERIFAAIHANLGRTRLFMVGIGSAPNGHLMRHAAEIGRGSFTEIRDLAQVGERTRALYEKLEFPAVTSLTALGKCAGMDAVDVALQQNLAGFLASLSHCTERP